MASDISDKLSFQIKLRGITQKKLAQLSDLTEATVSGYIKGTRLPNSANLRKLANALDIPVSDLILTGDTTFEQDFKEIKSIILKRRSQWTDKQKLELIESLFERY